MCHDDPRLTYLDVANPVLGADGKPDPSLLRDDGLHLNEAGYAKWTAIVGPAVLKASGKSSQ
jgi:lysophospholipase L1-like esterase